jgi:hypothetical protein
MEGGRKVSGASRSVINQIAFYVEIGRCRRAYSHGAQVRAGTKTLDQSLPTDVDMTRCYSILSPPEFDGEVCERTRTIVRLPREVHYEEISHRAPRAIARMGR